MQVGLNLLEAENLYGGEVRKVLELAALADDAGVDLLSTGDHLGFDAERVAVHSFPFALDTPWYEPVSLLSAVAAVTRRARLGVSVLVATLRPPVLLATPEARSTWTRPRGRPCNGIAGATVVVFRPAVFGVTAAKVPALVDWMVGLKKEAQ
ncbi:LLM class flavin-dependent oxidoreductase [Rhodococcus gannanensis]|uniref:LLM class flavin-dependent oxidoreductase n=1 Tax=Rhodococcus gannanensis TaxID=1960308 RepID=A0ABW4P9L5_9NOCA